MALEVVLKVKKSSERNFVKTRKSKCHGNFKSRIAKKEEKSVLMHLIEQKSCNINSQIQKNTEIASKVGDGECKKCRCHNFLSFRKNKKKTRFF